MLRGIALTKTLHSCDQCRMHGTGPAEAVIKWPGIGGDSRKLLGGARFFFIIRNLFTIIIVH